MSLASRRRALLGQKKDDRLLYHLSTPIVNSEKQFFNAGVNPITKDQSFTIHVDLTATARDTVPVAIGALGSGAYSYNKVFNGLKAYGGVGFVQANLSDGLSPFLWAKKLVATNMSWTASYRYRLCIVHAVGTDYAILYLKLNNNSVQIFTSPTGEFVFPDNGTLRSFFQGTLDILDVYSSALSEAECRVLIE